MQKALSLSHTVMNKVLPPLDHRSKDFLKERRSSSNPIPSVILLNEQALGSANDVLMAAPKSSNGIQFFKPLHAGEVIMLSPDRDQAYQKMEENMSSTLNKDSIFCSLMNSKSAAADPDQDKKLLISLPTKNTKISATDKNPLGLNPMETPNPIEEEEIQKSNSKSRKPNLSPSRIQDQVLPQEMQREDGFHANSQTKDFEQYA